MERAAEGKGMAHVTTMDRRRDEEKIANIKILISHYIIIVFE